MKRKTVKTLLCAALMAIALSATACGGSDAGNDSAAPAEEASTPDDASAEEETPDEEEAPVEEEADVDEEASDDEEAPAADDVSDEEDAATDDASTGTVSSGKTLQEYLEEDPTAKQQLEDQAAAQGNDTIDMSIEVVGNDIFCVGTFKDSVDIPADAADTLNEGMDTLETAFSAIAGVLDEAIGAEKGTVSYGIRYCDSDGNVIVEKSFRAQ